MAFGGFNDKQQAGPMADINVTPMVDVMLVLLVIFIITAPLFTHAIKLDLPAAQSAPAPAEPSTISLSINGANAVFWNNDAVTLDELSARLAVAAKQQPQPQVQLRADKGTRYEIIAQVMAASQNNGITKLGFVTETPQAAKK
ncbi:Biopolymer transport protein ExbD [compost metagenome]